MTNKKEKLKFYRLPSTPSYQIDTPTSSICGYKNVYSEFRAYATDRYEEEVNGEGKSQEWLGEAPEKFFAIGKYGNLKNIEFVINGVFEKYDRTKHDLASLSSKIYVLETSEAGTFGVPYATTGADKHPYIQSVDKESLKSISFYVNPSSIKLRKKKFFQKLRTRAGWAFQHWGPDIGEIMLEGTTGNITPDPKIQMGKVFGLSILPQVVEEAPTASNSPALKAFRKLERWYDEDQNDQSQSSCIGQLTALEFRGRVYVGHFAEFNFEERGTHPFQLFYQLKFLIHYDAGALSEATTRTTNQVVRNSATLRQILELKKAQSESETPTTLDGSMTDSPSLDDIERRGR